MERAIQEVAEKIAAGRKNVALTGAGISVESGVPDFRSPGGLWERFDPMEYASIEAFEADPVKVWQMLAEMSRVLEAAAPNPAHLALARLEALGRLAGVITQNIDNLHRAAGSQQVVEYHGNASRLICLSCGVRQDALDARRRMQAAGDEGPPRCPHCDRVLKPDAVFFGEPIPAEPGRLAMELSSEPDVFMVVGTSGMVAPASYLPVVAKKTGGLIVEINPEQTPLSEGFADRVLRGPAGELLPELARRVEALVPGA